MTQINEEAFRRIESDIQEVLPAQIEIIREDIDGETAEDYALGYYRLMNRAVRGRRRIESLSYAYMIGRIIEEDATRTQRRNIKRDILKHYFMICIRIYQIFGFLGIDQIYRSKEMNLNDFRVIRTGEVAQLMQWAQEEQENRALFDQMWDEHHNQEEDWDSGNDYDDDITTWSD